MYAENIEDTSDKNLKKNISTLFDALPVIRKLRPVSFDYNFDYSGVKNIKVRNKLQTDDKNRLGFIAQEVQEILPQSVSTKEPDSTLCLRMMDFVPLLVKGMQEQTGYIDSLILVVNELKASQAKTKRAQLKDAGDNSQLLPRLYQNDIGIYTNQTIINCFIPVNSNEAYIRICDMQGTIVKACSIIGRDQTSVAVPGAELLPGMYTYSLMIDNREIDSKRMILRD